MIVVSRTSQGFPVLVRDVAEVRFGEAVRYGALTHADDKKSGEAVGGIVMMLKNENASTVVKSVEKRVEQIRPVAARRRGAGSIPQPQRPRGPCVGNRE